MNADKFTTIVGVVGAAAAAAQPVLSGVTTGTLHGPDYFQLISAVVFAVLGFFSNRKSAKE